MKAENARETDEAIYARFLRYRDENDLRLLFDRYRENLILFLIGYVRNAEDAEELIGLRARRVFVDRLRAAAPGRRGAVRRLPNGDQEG